MFSAQYWYIGLLTLLVMVSQTFALLFLARHKWITRVILWCMAIFMLVFESVIFARNPDQMPIAFSTFTYFLFGIGVFVPWRPVRTTAAICSFVAGAIYMSGFLFRPELLTHGAALGMGYMQGFLLHDVLLMGGLLMLTQIRIKKIDAALVFAFVAFCVAYTEIAVHVYAIYRKLVVVHIVVSVCCGGDMGRLGVVVLYQPQTCRALAGKGRLAGLLTRWVAVNLQYGAGFLPCANTVIKISIFYKIRFRQRVTMLPCQGEI